MIVNIRPQRTVTSERKEANEVSSTVSQAYYHDSFSKLYTGKGNLKQNLVDSLS